MRISKRRAVGIARDNEEEMVRDKVGWLERRGIAKGEGDS